MSTGSGALQQVHPVGRHGWIAVAVAVLLTVAIAVAIAASRSADVTSPVDDVVQGSNRMSGQVAIAVDGIRPHGPRQMPKRFAASVLDVQPHGANHMPKR